MTKIILPVFYFPTVSWFAEFFRNDVEITLEQSENFPKQTYRNRANIYGANGKLSLIIPMQHSGSKDMKSIQVSDQENWRGQHWKSIVSAYKGSPYFDFYEDRLKAIFESSETSLLKLNLSIIEMVQKILKTEVQFDLSSEYVKDFEGEDFREHWSAKKSDSLNHPEYYQTFSEKHGFIENLSIIDLICNEGPEAISYLKSLSK